VAGQFKTEWRVYHRHHGHWFCPAVCNVWFGCDERTVRSDGRQPAWHQDMSGGWLLGIRCVCDRTPIPKGGGTDTRLLSDGCLVGVLDGVSDRCVNGARF